MRNKGLRLACIITAVLMLLSGCSGAVGVILSETGLGRIEPATSREIVFPSSAPRRERARSSSDPYDRYGSYDSGPSQPYIPDEPTIYYNGYLGLVFNIPPECYDSYDWYFYLYDDRAATELPELSANPDNYNWEYDDDGASTTLFEIYYYPDDAYGMYSVMLDYYPEWTDAEYAAYFEDYITDDMYDGYGEYVIESSEPREINGIMYTRYVVRDKESAYPEYDYAEEYYLAQVKDMYLIIYTWYSQDDEKSADTLERLLQEVVERLDMNNGV